MLVMFCAGAAASPVSVSHRCASLLILAMWASYG